MTGTRRTLAMELNAFLQFEPADRGVLHRYRETLTRDVARFSTTLLDDLLKFPETSRQLKQYQREGGKISSLQTGLTKYLLAVFAEIDTPEHQERFESIRALHYWSDISPAWIQACYARFQRYLHDVIATSPEIAADERPQLSTIIDKLLFLDMGLLLDGYWQAATAALAREKTRVKDYQQQISYVLNHLPQIIWSIDVVNDRPVYISPAAQEISPECAVLPEPWLNWTLEEDRTKVAEAWNLALSGKRTEVESRVQTSNGQIRWFRRTFNPFARTSGTICRIDCMLEEITDTVAERINLAEMATIDTLTGLANRGFFFTRLNQALLHARTNPGKHVIIMLLDINRFKNINDTLGFPVGDIIIKQVAERLAGKLRDSDTLARIGGDEFAILLPAEEECKHSALTVAEKIQDCFHEAYLHENNELYLGVSIGFAAYPDDGLDADGLVRHADMAMYTSKRNDVSQPLFENSLDVSPKRMVLSRQLKQGVLNHEFELHFQPKIDLLKGQPSGVEALIRWNHPERGILLPGSFIPLAEKLNLMNEITEWVLARALEHYKMWQGQGIHAPIAINVSARSFQDHNFINHIRKALDLTGASPDCIEIEITENTLMSNIEHCTNVIKNLSKLGIAIAIDDFGTGYSSLAYLKRLPIDHIKIDRLFVQDMDRNENDSAIVRSVIDLGHNLGIKVIAEGVERPDAMRMLEALGCDAAQGFHISRPLPATHIDQWIRQTTPRQ